MCFTSFSNKVSSRNRGFRRRCPSPAARFTHLGSSGVHTRIDADRLTIVPYDWRGFYHNSIRLPAMTALFHHFSLALLSLTGINEPPMTGLDEPV